jgi:MFS transporter, PAT family, beta-lactamase induction signal transducer AmpG
MRARIGEMTRTPRTTLLSLAILLYFSEGFPYGLITELLPIYLRVSGVSRTEISFLSTIGLIWTLKLFWSPLVDRFGTYRRWTQGALLLIVVSLLGMAVIGTTSMSTFWILVTLLAIGSATQDIAIDAWTIAATPTSLLGLVNSVRVSAYRVAIIIAGGAVATIADRAGWNIVFFACAAVAATILLLTIFMPRSKRAPGEHATLASVRSWLQRPGFGAILAFLLLYRLGDSLLRPMVKVFWIDQGYSAAETGTVTTVAGMIFTIAGAFAGGALMTRIGIFRGLFWLGLAQMLSNVGYALVATFGGGRSAMYAAAVTEQFCDGLGTAAFLGFLMAICDVHLAAVEYALLSAIFGYSRQLSGGFSGSITDAIGYPMFFWLTTLAALPGLAMLPRIRAPLAERVRIREEMPEAAPA